LDADRDVPVAQYGAACEVDVGGIEILELAVGGDAGARDVDQRTADLRRAARDRGDLIEIVGAARPGVDPGGVAGLPQHRRAPPAAASMGVDVDQAGGHDLAARVDRLGGVARNIGFDRRDAAGGDRDVAYGIESDRRIDDAAALDNEVVGRG